MARVLVRNAAKTSTDMRGLGNALIEHIAEPADRSAFLQKVGAISSSLGGLARTQTTAPKPTAPGTATATALSEATLEHSVKVMTRHIGPIAKIVVRKASAVAGTQEQFFQLLADQAEGVDRNKLLLELQQRR